MLSLRKLNQWGWPKRLQAEVQKSGVAAYMILSFLSRRINELERARMIFFWFLEGGG
jgi:hypothetical protein